MSIHPLKEIIARIKIQAERCGTEFRDHYIYLLKDDLYKIAEDLEESSQEVLIRYKTNRKKG